MEKIKIGLQNGKIITREKLYQNISRFHKEQARLPFEEKIAMMIKLQVLAKGIKRNNKMIWKV